MDNINMSKKEQQEFDQHDMLMSKLYAERQKLDSDRQLNSMKIKWYWIFIVIAIIGAVTGIVSLILQLVV
jgi:hypothetical protein